MLHNTHCPHFPHNIKDPLKLHYRPAWLLALSFESHWNMHNSWADSKLRLGGSVALFIYVSPINPSSNFILITLAELNCLLHLPSFLSVEKLYLPLQHAAIFSLLAKRAFDPTLKLFPQAGKKTDTTIPT